MQEDWTMKTRSPMKMKYVLAFAAALACAPLVRGDVPLTGPFTPAPGTAEAAFLMANESAIMRLAAEARTGETDARRAALEALANAYSDAALNLATELIKDSDTAVATESAKLLADTLAMAGSVTMGERMHSAGTPARLQFDAAIANLRDAVGDPRIEVRHVAAENARRFGRSHGSRQDRAVRETRLGPGRRGN